MKRWMLGFFIVLLILFSSAHLAFAFNGDIPQEVIKASSRVVKVRITGFEKGGWRNFSAQGSGFFVSPNKVLTASHVGESIEEIFNRWFSLKTVEVGGKDYPVVGVVGTHLSGELALLEIREDFPSYVLEFGEAEAGDEVFFVGFSGARKRIFSGKVVEVDGDMLSVLPKEPKHKLTLLGKILPGMSGGPILNKQGKVVGLIWGGGPTDQVRATPVDEIEKFLKENKDK